MKKSRFFLVLVMALAPIFAMAQTENVELGLQVGAGFFLGLDELPTPGYTRVNEFAWMRDSEGMPAFESYGGIVRYRFDYRWTLQAQAMRQRMRFKESVEGQDPLYFYNSMWNADVMAEFNILKYGFVENRNARVYTVTPYVAVGIGTSLYNEHATYRWNAKHLEGATGTKRNTFYPAVKARDLAAALYIPFGAGLKLRMASNWQLKVACQYDLYVLNGNVDGSTAGVGTEIEGEKVYPNGGGVSFEGVQYKAASTHNVVATVGVIYNLPSNGRAGVMVNY